jgi:acylpyruvate hydrolase
MRLATIRTAAGHRAVRVDDGAPGAVAVETGDADVRALLTHPEWRARAAAAAGPSHALDTVDYAPLVPAPEKIICVGLNYRDHAEEQGTALPEAPLLFAKWQNTLIGPGEAIVIPPVVTKCDYEAELGVVIGERVRDVSAENALEAVAGYVCVNDVSARDLQFADGQWTRGKSPDTFCPVGPALVSRDDLPDPQALPIRAILNGETVQESTTANMIFGVADVIAYVTRTITLEPGDLIATGTPAGVGAFRDPPVFMGPGDEITIEIEGIGSLTNPVVAG